MPRGIVLLSGGLDSATTLALAIRDGFEAHALTIRYGQRHAVEVERAALLARSLGARSHRVLSIDLGGLGGSALTDPSVPIPKGRSAAAIGSDVPSTYVPARNTILLSLALAWAEVLGAEDLFLGANAIDYSGYPDCRPEYLAAFEALANLATRATVEGARVRLHAPLLHRTKGDIVRLAADLGVDLALTISCYDPSALGEPCGSCDACLLRSRGFEDAGMADPSLAPRVR
jgi:7-cyano-7-deazaguanine synthase